MTAVKIVLSAVVTVVVLLVVTYSYLAIILRRADSPRGSVGLDVVLLPRLTIYSPMYWLVVVVVIAGLWWILGKWLFAK